MDVLLSYDNLGEAYDLLRFGHAGGGVSDGIYANRRGIPRVLEMLARLNLTATFFIEGWSAQQHPGLVAEIVAAGHEVGAHGWLHEEWDGLDLEEERELIKRTTAAIGDAIGRAPVGWRSPWLRTTRHTMALLADEGYRYDSSFMDDDRPYRLQVAPGDARSLIELPVNPVLNDTPFYNPPNPIRTPEEAMATWWGELAGLARDAGFAAITAHPRHTGRPARLAAHEDLIRRLLDGELGEVRFLRCDEAAEHYANSEGLPSYPAPAQL